MYKPIPRALPGAGNGEIKFYPAIVRERNVGFRQVIKEIAELNTLNTADVYAVVDSLLQLLNRHLSHGRTIELGHFGNFSIGFKTAGVETPEDVRREQILRTKIHFRPSQELKELLSMIHFEKVDNPDLEVPKAA